MILFDTEAKRIRRTEIKILNREINTTRGKVPLLSCQIHFKAEDFKFILQ
jgi:hypothetical protein